MLPADLGLRLDGVHDELDDPGHLRFAAVIGLLLEHEAASEGPSLVLIERSGALRQHAGQIAFPGGKPEPDDRDLLDTALREASEEVGLPRELVSVAGRLSPVPTPTGYMIVPYIGRVRAAWQPERASAEVERVLTPSLRTLMDPAIHRLTGTVDWQGQSYDLHEFAIAEPPLWGATARMVWDLLERIRG
ncbi:putative NUDIX hydrolase [Enhygromyxa salina]|uniref:Putative NUDIX hydrolase n=1 Tax=Enhygromyxa salina TaxID=215803 RepID=A0A2S9XBV6_9BACT|nr:CoA pyrophosphatase [Enhygromyxa salina]PRP90161.1 putative NUDIX hydrolase [Enhygromyxa salina]